MDRRSILSDDNSATVSFDAAGDLTGISYNGTIGTGLFATLTFDTYNHMDYAIYSGYFRN